MLIEFTARNYKSFQEMAFSMKPAPKQKGWITVSLLRK